MWELAWYLDDNDNDNGNGNDNDIDNGNGNDNDNDNGNDNDFENDNDCVRLTWILDLFLMFLNKVGQFNWTIWSWNAHFPHLLQIEINPG